MDLVDLAGSERKEDSGYHDKTRQKEATAINMSLMSLKDCMRSKAAGNAQTKLRLAYRSSILTRILKVRVSLP